MNFCLTNAGKEYMARVNAGEIVMHLVRAVTGSGSSSSLDILSNVVDEQQQIQMDEVRSDGEYTFIHCVLSNLQLEREYVLHQLGLFAVNGAGEETLIIIGQDAYGDRIPAFAEKEVEYLYSIGLRVSNAAEVTFDFSINDFLRKKYFYEHLDEFEKYKKDIQEQFKALPRVKVAEKEQLDRKDTIVFELLKDTNKVVRILERDSQDKTHKYEFASVFSQAAQRENLESEDMLSTLFGKIKKYFADMKVNCFKEADNPFVLMTEATYKAPGKRTAGSLYGLITKTRGLIVISFDRYVQGLEEPRQELTLYGVETTAKAEVEKAANPYVGVITNLVFIDPEGGTVNRESGKLYATIKMTKGG